MDAIRAFFAGRKEIILGILGGLGFVLAAFGFAPELLDPLKTVANEAAAGNWQAAIGALLAGVLLWMRAFKRMGENRAAKNGPKALAGGK